MLKRPSRIALAPVEATWGTKSQLLLGACLLAALVVRCWHLGTLPLSADEHFAVYAALKPSSLEELFALLQNNPHHVVLEPLLNFIVGRMATSVFFLRLPAALLGTLAVWLTFRLGSRLSSPRLGLIASALLAISMLHVEYSRQVNFYAALTFLTLLSVLSVMRALESERWGALIACGLAHLLLFYTHPYAPLVAVIELVWAWVYHRNRFANLLTCLAAAGSLYLPYYHFVLHRILSAHTFQNTFKLSKALFETLACWAQAAELTLSELPRLDVLIQRKGAPFFYLAFYLYGLSRVLSKRERTPAWALAVGWLPAAWLAVVIADARIGYFFVPRQTIFILPFYLLVVARGIEAALERASQARPAFGWTVGSSIAMIIVSLFARAYAADFRIWSEMAQYRRGLTRSVQDTVRNQDVLLFRSPHAAQSFLYLYDREAFLHVLPPRLYNGVYTFKLPKELWASNGTRRNQVFSLVNLDGSVAESTEYWRQLAHKVQGGGRIVMVRARDYLGCPYNFAVPPFLQLVHPTAVWVP